MKIKNLMKEIHGVNVEKGFWDNKETKNVGEVLMLCVSELSEALEAHREDRFANIEHFKEKINSYTESEKIINFDEDFKSNIKDSFEDEIADTVIRIFDMAEGFGIDLEWHIRQKIDYNKNRPHKHGKKY